MDNFKIFLAKYVIFIIILIWVWAWIKTKRSLKPQLVVTTIVAGIFALILSRIASKLYYDPRPFVSSHIKPLISHAANNGFPSDHTLLGATLAAIIYPYRKKWALLAGILAILVAVGRVLVHVHSPIDVVGAFAIGMVSAAAGYFIAKRLKPAPQKTQPAAKPTSQTS